MLALSYPTYIEIDGIKYEINTSFKVGLLCFYCIEDNTISNVERSYRIIYLLYKEEPHDMEQALEEAIKYLMCGKERTPESSHRKADMSYTFDVNYIKSSFVSDYKIDLDIEDMHWWKFHNLVNGLSEKCILNRIRDIRGYDLNSIKDSKARMKMQQAQQELALPTRVSFEEQCIIDEFEALINERE